MLGQEIMQSLESDPFRPFSLIFKSGDRVEVLENYHLAMSDDRTTILWLTDDYGYRTAEVSSIVQIEFIDQQAVKRQKTA